MAASVPADLLAIAEVLLPQGDLSAATVTAGEFRDVVLLPGVAAIRVAGGTAAAGELPRRMALLERLQTVGLPFAVPTPLTPVIDIGRRSAIAVSWLRGHNLTHVKPVQLSAILTAIEAVITDSLC